MGYIVIAVLIVGDLWLYVHSARPENSIWRDEAVFGVKP